MTNLEIIDRIERTTGAIYDAGTYNSLTQARLRSIRADLDVLRASLKPPECPLAARCPLPEGWDG
jgi:hypothetical protein